MARYTPPTRTKNDEPEKVPAACHRCNGHGTYVRGVCFACHGHKKSTRKNATVWAFPETWTEAQIAEFKAEEAAKKAARDEKNQQRKIRKAHKHAEAQLEANPDLASVLVINEWGRLGWNAEIEAERMKDGQAFIRCVGRLAQEFVISKVDKYIMTEKQAAVIVNAGQRVITRRDETAAREQAWEAKKAEERETLNNVPEGRYTVTGEVLSCRMKDTPYGSAWKMLVMAEGGFKVYGTVPSSIDTRILLDGELTGKTVTFTATFTAKEKGFGFFSRPTKGSIKAEA